MSDPVDMQGNLALAAENKLEESSYEEDPFWAKVGFASQKWDKYCPYQLIVVKIIKDKSDITYVPYKNLKYTFSLPPQSVTISMPFATQLTPTLGGVIEENNGIPLRHIQITGTSGFLPGRASGADRSSNVFDKIGQQAAAIFGGTVDTIGRATDSFVAAGQALTNSAPTNNNLYSEAFFDNDSDSVVKTSGFIQTGLLIKFLESYAAIKKKPQGAELRLVFAIWKEDQVFLVSPVSLDLSKTAQNPMESGYSLQLKAWKRIKLNSGGNVPVQLEPIRHNPNVIAQAINTLSAARKAIRTLGSLKQAVLGDIDYVFKPFHDAILLAKDTLGTALTLMEVPLAVRQRVTINVSELKFSSSELWNSITSSQTWDPSIRALKYSVDKTNHIQDMPVGYRSSSVSANNTQARNTHSGTTQLLRLSDLPDGLAEALPVQALNLPVDAIRDINRDLDRVRKLTRKDFEEHTFTLQSLADRVSFLLGAGDPTYAETYGIPIQSDHITSTIDWSVLSALDDSIAVMQQFAATADGSPTQSSTILDTFGDLATSSGIAWTKPTSKFAIPVPYGVTLEALSATYLGDPNRWMEIAALNGLREPYIDEIGYTLPLLSNGQGNTIVVTYNPDLFVGKTIWLTSTSTNKKKATIEGISVIGNTSTIKVSEDASLYLVSNSASIEAFLSGTTNSRYQIWIPSDREPLNEEDVIKKDIQDIDVTDPMVGICGVDVLLDSAGDLVVVNGDSIIVSGINNVIQWVSSVLGMKQGELLQHPSVGLPIEVGTSLSDFSAQDLLKAIKKMLQNDATFSRIDKIKVVQKAGVATIDISAIVTGTFQPLPLSYKMPLV